MSSSSSRLRPLRRNALSLALRGALLGGAAITPALLIGSVHAATADSRHYDIPVGTLEDSLNQFAQVAGITLPFDPALVRGKQAPALRGEYGVQDGLTTLLAGSGLSSTQTQGGHWLLYPAGEQGTAMLLPSSLVTGQGVDLTSEHTGSYAVAASNSVTRLPLSVRETPQSISVITRQQMDDQGMQNISDVLRQAPGITVNRENSEGYTFYARGFEIQNFQYDGIPSLSSEGGTLRDNYSIGNSLIYTASKSSRAPPA